MAKGNKLWRLLVAVVRWPVGIFLIAAGIILGPLPVFQGFAMIALGLVVLGKKEWVVKAWAFCEKVIKRTRKHMENKKFLNLLGQCGALMDGHFLLSSGKHSSRYVQCALALQDSKICSKLCAALAERWRDKGVNVVVAPALGGIVFSYELGRHLGVRGIFMERPSGGEMTLRRGFAIAPQEKVLIAEDVITTGGSVKEIMERVRAIGAEIVGVAAIVDRSSGIKFDCQAESCVQMEIPAYDPDSCPMCGKGMPVVKPGSREVT